MKGRNDKVAKRYARAIFDSVEPAKYDQLLQVFELASQLWSESADFRELARNPLFNGSERWDALRKTLEGTAALPSDAVRDTFKLLCENDRLTILPELSSFVAELVREYRKALSVEVVSAFALSDEDKKGIQQQLEKALSRTVTLDWSVDQDLIGGMLFKVGDKLIDRSVGGMLQQFKGHLTV